MIREYKESDFEELLRMRCLLYPRHTRQELREEIAAFVHHPHQNPFRNYERWTSFVHPRKTGGLCGFIDVGFVYADEYREQLAHFAGTPYARQMEQWVAEGRAVPVVESWYVDEDARGKHIGSGLMRRAEAWAKEHGSPFLVSDTDDFRTVSQKAHAALGYTQYHIDEAGCHYFYKPVE